MMLQRTWVDTAANEPDEEIIHEICMRLCNRENLIDILNAGGMPSLRVFYKWINQYPEWKKMYHDALEIKMHGLVEETVLIADNVDPKLVKKAELQIKSRQWVAAECYPICRTIRRTAGYKVHAGEKCRMDRVDRNRLCCIAHCHRIL